MTLDTVANDEPKAWVFYEDESRTKVRFVLTDPARVQAWASAHKGPIVPLYERREECGESSA